jgi:hypothetical protein
MSRAIQVNPKLLQQHAGDCDRMAKECSDLFARDALHELATKFRRAAQALERSTAPQGGRARRGWMRRPASDGRKAVDRKQGRADRRRFSSAG